MGQVVPTQVSDLLAEHVAFNNPILARPIGLREFAAPIALGAFADVDERAQESAHRRVHQYDKQQQGGQRTPRGGVRQALPETDRRRDAGFQFGKIMFAVRKWMGRVVRHQTTVARNDR